MKVLYLRAASGLDRAYPYFADAIDERYQVEIFDPDKSAAEQFEGVVVALLLQVHPSKLEQLVELPGLASGLRSVAGAGGECDGCRHDRGAASRGCDGMFRIVSRH